MKKESNFLNRNIGWIIICFLLLSLFAPYILTRPAFVDFDFAETGQIGDTIGGLVSPILNLLSIILLFLTLRDQSRSVLSQREFDSIIHQQSALKSDLDKISFIRNNPDKTTIRGFHSLFEISMIFNSSTNIASDIDEASLRSFHLSFTYILSNLNRLLETNSNSSIRSSEKKVVYDTLFNLKNPIIMVCNSAGAYYQKIKTAQGRTLTELDKTMALFPIIALKLNETFDSNKIEKC